MFSAELPNQGIQDQKAGQDGVNPVGADPEDLCPCVPVPGAEFFCQCMQLTCRKFPVFRGQIEGSVDQLQGRAGCAADSADVRFFRDPAQGRFHFMLRFPGILVEIFPQGFPFGQDPLSDGFLLRRIGQEFADICLMQIQGTDGDAPGKQRRDTVKDQELGAAAADVQENAGL